MELLGVQDQVWVVLIGLNVLECIFHQLCFSITENYKESFVEEELKKKNFQSFKCIGLNETADKIINDPVLRS